MSSVLSINAWDRVLILAPHPDDESLATGGLIQTALAAGAAVRVLLFTDGDNNPWPQRWIEKRWRIGTVERTRWGARRREEAQQALRCLGLTAQHTHFLGLPDMGLTDLLMRADGTLLQALVAELQNFRPTQLVIPGLRDRHPDHSATSVLARMALQRTQQSQSIELLSYLVHTDLTTIPITRRLTLNLTPSQIQRKREAIAAHATQMRLSGKRFLGFAKPYEYFMAAPTSKEELLPSGDHAECYAKELHIHLRGRIRSGEELLLALENTDGSSLRARLALPLHDGAFTLRDSVNARPMGVAKTKTTGDGVTLTLQPAATLALAFAKRQKKCRGLLVFDRAGWFEATRKGD